MNLGGHLTYLKCTRSVQLPLNIKMVSKADVCYVISTVWKEERLKARKKAGKKKKARKKERNEEERAKSI